VSRSARQARREAKRFRLIQGANLRANSVWATLIQSLAFVRKELAEIVRQPRLLALLVAGPFLLLLLFGIGFRDTSVALRTKFVAPPGSAYEEGVARYTADLDAYIDSQGFTEDKPAALGELDDGELDAVIVFPPDALSTVLAGEPAPIEILHNKLDPFQETAVQIAARLAVLEVNASVVGAVAGGAQQAIGPMDDVAAGLSQHSAAIIGAVDAGNVADVAATGGALTDTLDRSAASLESTRAVLAGVGGDEQAGAYEEMLGRVDELRAEAAAVSLSDGDDTLRRAEVLAESLDAVAADLPQLSTVDAEVLARPFAAHIQNVAAVAIKPADYFAPSSIVLLLQHLALTFAALSLVRDRQLGLFELLRVGPLSSAEILAGKTIAYLFVGGGVSAALMVAAVGLLDVPFAGDLGWAAMTVVLVLLASLAMGLVISLMSGTETEAVQYAMLTLLAGMFFSGFILDIELLSFPVRYLSYALPVTFGVSMMRDVMLRGLQPSTVDLVGLGALVALYGLLAVVMLRRKLKTA
jgi:ABC-2 type transport system permease protein